MLDRRVTLRGLSSIAGDLWGTTPPLSPVREQPAVPAFPPFEQLWHTADETVDWTEALVYDAPTDGMTEPSLWKIYHQYAQAVLSGNVDAYTSVLRALPPLEDLAPYAASFDVIAVDADRLDVCINALPPHVQGEGGRRYQAGMCLRAARDLFALLPVTQVQASMVCGEKMLLRVSFQRSDMQRIRFAFVDPVDFVDQCAGAWQEQ